MSYRPKKIQWVIILVIIFITVVSFPFVYSAYQSANKLPTLSTSLSMSASNSTTSTIKTSSIENPTSGPPYASPGQICAGLPDNAIGNVTYSSNATHVYVLIVEADVGSSYAGINGSYSHSIYSSWPVITVYQGQEVTIHVLNCPSSPEPHGFAIGNYFAGGVTLARGQSYTFTFVANTVGRFTVFCNVYCAIHQYMQNGELLVKPIPSG